jgi:glucose-6-phosphate 1-epimerase
MPDSSPLSTLVPGSGGLPKVILTAPDGARAEIYPYGAHLTSWIPTGGLERLFLSRTAEFRPGTAIRGGTPVIFPQFSGLGPLPKHGFARVTPWKFSGARLSPGGQVLAGFELGETPASHALWPHPFRAWLELGLGGRRLSLTLRVENSGETPFQFTAALHTYLRVNDLPGVRIGGLGGAAYLDNQAGLARAIQPEPWLTFSGEVDRVYLSPPGAVRLEEPGRPALAVSSPGFPDVVAWSPGPLKGPALADLEPPDGWRHFVCLEAAAASAPVSLEPGELWQGSQVLEEEE